MHAACSWLARIAILVDLLVWVFFPPCFRFVKHFLEEMILLTLYISGSSRKWSRVSATAGNHFSNEWMTDSLLLFHICTFLFHCSLPPGKHSPWPHHYPVLPQIHQPLKVGKIPHFGPLLLQVLSSYGGAVYSHGHQRALLKAQDSLGSFWRAPTCVVSRFFN